MTDWRAVGIGFLVGVVAGFLAFALPVIGHIGAGLIAGVAAGYVACSDGSDGSDGLLRGAWHGLLAGAIGGVLLAVLFAVLATFVGGLVGGPAGSLLGGGGVLVVGIGIAFVHALDSALGGAVGALVA